METKSVKDSGLIDIIKKKFSSDTIVLLVTAKDNVPSVRSVDSFYYDGSFWIVTDSRCNYVQEIKHNTYTMISDGGHNRMWCEAKVAGHPLDENNKAIREVYLDVFSNWYKEVNNEDLTTTCYIQVTPYKGYIHQDKLGYSFDMRKDLVEVKETTHHIDVALKPFW